MKFRRRCCQRGCHIKVTSLEAGLGKSEPFVHDASPMVALICPSPAGQTAAWPVLPCLSIWHDWWHLPIDFNAFLLSPFMSKLAKIVTTPGERGLRNLGSIHVRDITLQNKPIYSCLYWWFHSRWTNFPWQAFPTTSRIHGWTSSSYFLYFLRENRFFFIF